MSTIEAVVGNQELPPLEHENALYHWAPEDRRRSIADGGLRIRQKSAHAPIRYPYVSLAPDALAAWRMSGGAFVGTGVTRWDLWCVYVGSLHGFEVVPTDDRRVREVRVYRSIPARHVEYVGSRSTDEDA